MDQDVIEARWVCDVVDSGYHNGCGCSPRDPHAEWRCGYRYRLSYFANDAAKELLERHGFTVIEPPQ